MRKPEPETPNQAAPEFLIPRLCEILNYCSFEPVRFGTVMSGYVDSSWQPRHQRQGRRGGSDPPAIAHAGRVRPIVIDQFEASSTSGSFCPAASSPGPSFGAALCRGHVMSPSPFLSGSLPYKNRHISFITALNTEASSSVVVTVSLCHQISNSWRLSRGLSPSVSCQSLRFCELLAARCFWFWFW